MILIQLFQHKYFGHAVRAIKNQLTRDFEQAEKMPLNKKIQDLEIFEQWALSLSCAVVHGDVDGGSTGQIAGLVSKEETVEEILKDIYWWRLAENSKRSRSLSRSYKK